MESDLLITDAAPGARAGASAAAGTGDAAPGAGSVPLRLDPGKTRRVAFPVRATTAGEARVRFRAVFEGAEDAVEVRVPVIDLRLARTAAAAGRTAGTLPEIIQLPPAAIPGSATLDMQLSPSVISGVEQAFLQRPRLSPRMPGADLEPPPGHRALQTASPKRERRLGG